MTRKIDKQRRRILKTTGGAALASAVGLPLSSGAGEGEADELVRCAWSWLVDVHVHCEHVRALVVAEMHMCSVCPLVYGLGFRFRYVCVASVLTQHMCGCVYVMSVLWLSSEQEELTAKSAHVRTAPRCL